MSKSAFPTLPWERLYFSVPRRHNQCDAQKQKNTLLKYDSPLLVWSWRDSSPGRVVQSMCKYSTGEVAGKLSWKWWDGGPSALWCTKTPFAAWAAMDRDIPTIFQLRLLHFPKSSPLKQASLSSGTGQPPVELKTRAFSLALLQEDSSTHFIPSPGPGQPTFLKYTFLQLPGFVKLKSMFAKPLQLLGWKVVPQCKYHLINKEVSCLLKCRARKGLWEQNH